VIIEAVMKVYMGFLFLMAVNVWPVPCYFKENGIEPEKLFIQNAVHCKHLARTVILRSIVCSILHRIIACARAHIYVHGGGIPKSLSLKPIEI